MWIPPLPAPFHYRPNGVLYCIPAARIALASLGASGTNVFSSGKHEAIRTKKWRGWNLCCTRTWKWGRGSYPTHKHPVAIKKKKKAQIYTEHINAVVAVYVWRRVCISKNFLFWYRLRKSISKWSFLRLNYCVCMLSEWRCRPIFRNRRIRALINWYVGVSSYRQYNGSCN